MPEYNLINLTGAYFIGICIGAFLMWVFLHWLWDIGE